jgi:hypothetical protein
VDHVDESRIWPDPAGGSFNAAGDFGRLLGPEASLPGWAAIDPNAVTMLGAAAMDGRPRDLGLPSDVAWREKGRSPRHGAGAV